MTTTHPTGPHAASIETALDFVNTRELEHGEVVDRLPTTDEAFAWFVEHGLVHGRPAASDHQSGRPEIATVRAVREALRELLDANDEGRAPEAAALATVNRALRHRELVELTVGPDGIALDHRHVGDPIDEALARLAEPIARELGTGERDRLRVCDSETCRWVFHDTSRTGRRRWCDMATCGNRAKAARHRARLRGASAAAQSGSAAAERASNAANATAHA
jgi:predicted RNA-binding Zn ribbon-like protein